MRNIIFLSFLFLFSLASCGQQAPVSTSTTPYSVLSVDDAEKELAAHPNLQILDVRTPEEFADGHLSGAILMNFYADDFQNQLASLNKEEPILLYCRSGNRSGQAGKMMVDMGFKNLMDISGGFTAWKAADKKYELPTK